jgi:hypothetical protein
MTVFVSVSSGSFVHDVDLKIPAWTATKEELMVLSAAMHKIAEKNLTFERLVRFIVKYV